MHFLDADLTAVKKHYKDAQVLEIIFTVAGNNATARWTDALGIPQEGHRTFLTDTSEKNPRYEGVVMIPAS